MLEKKLKRIVPLDVLQSDELKDLIDMYAGGYGQTDEEEMAVEEDPVHPMSLSPKVLVPPNTPHMTNSILKKAAPAVAIGAAVASQNSWLSWKWIVAGVVVMFILFVLIRYWKMGRTLGFSYAFAAALPPMRLILAPMTGNTSDNMLAEIEAFNLGVHPIQKPAKTESPRKISVVKKEPNLRPQISKSELINQLIDEALQQHNVVSNSPKREVQRELSVPAAGDSPSV